MIVHICSQTDPGLARAQNEDSVASDESMGLCILADGMGGHNAGEVASGMAAAFIKSDMRVSLGDAGNGVKPAEVQLAIAQSVEKANSAIFNMSRTNPHYSGMGTTLVVGVFCDDVLVLGHIGDSRCYRVRDGAITQLTKDHSVLQEQVDHGLIYPDGIMPRLAQNFVTRALGVNDAVEVDFQQPTLADNDIYLMCSDGLSDMVDDGPICAILSGPGNLEDKARALIAAANSGGGRDNISVVLAQVADEPKAGLLNSARRALQGVWPGSKGR